MNKIKKSKTIKELIEFGIINIDKSSGPTSFNVSSFVKRKLELKKTAHFGTLDPKVTGVLPVALSRACKLTGYFLGEDKEYVGIMRIHEDISVDKIKKAIKEKFLGNIVQLPPVKSRVKREERIRKINSFEILGKDGKNILFKTICQGGTYIRKLCTDLGDYLEIGAHMLELRRIRAGIFKEDSIVNLYDFEKAVDEYKKGNEELLRKIIVPGEIASEVYAVVEIDNERVDSVLHGRPIYYKDLEDKKNKDLEKNKIFCAFSKNQFVGMFKVIHEGDFFARSQFAMQKL